MKRTYAHMDAGSLQLTPQERMLFDTIMDAVGDVPDCHTTVRVAGGWVRDKLLGVESDDIDIALDDKSGHDFARLVTDYLRKKGEQAHTIGIIHANPEQSKHLETATVNIGDFSVDFVNLRSETYTESSRIPTIVFGTAAEDAQRRDFTINALFYNLNTGQIEDLTERGLDDLQAGILRTPLEPHTTFMDDPLRMLRAVRFASRYAFKMDERMYEAIADPSIKEALIHKVSRERVGTELESMLSGKSARPAAAFAFLYRCNLLDAVLLLPRPEALQSHIDPRWTAVGIDTLYWANALLSFGRINPHVSGLEYLGSQQATSEQSGNESAIRLAADDGEHKDEALRESFALSADAQYCVVSEYRLLYLTAALCGLAHVTYTEKKKPTPVVAFCVREGLKFKNADVKLAVTMLDEMSAARRFAAEGESSRVVLGLWMLTVETLWENIIVLACASELSELAPRIFPTEGDFFHEVTLEYGSLQLTVIRRYNILRERIRSLDLIGVWQMRPLIDGKTLADRLGLPPGRSVGDAKREQTRWQLANPTGSESELMAYLRSQLAER